MNPPLVVKVGGSLLEWDQLPSRLEQFLLSLEGVPVALLAGGGPAVDWIRKLDHIHALGEECSHHLAIDCLELTARVLSALLPTRLVVVDHPRQFAATWQAGKLPVLAPRRFLAAEDQAPDPLEHNWRMTSDTIAARLAHRVGGELVLLKSTSLPEPTTLEAAARAGFVDANFPAEARTLARVCYINLRSHDPRLTPLLIGED